MFGQWSNRYFYKRECQWVHGENNGATMSENLITLGTVETTLPSRRVIYRMGNLGQFSRILGTVNEGWW